MRVFLIALLILAGIVPAFGRPTLKTADRWGLQVGGRWRSFPSSRNGPGTRWTVDKRHGGRPVQARIGRRVFRRGGHAAAGAGAVPRQQAGRKQRQGAGPAGPASASRSRKARPKPDISSVDAFKKALLAARRDRLCRSPPPVARAASIWPSCSRRWESPSSFKSKTVLVKGGTGRREGGERRSRRSGCNRRAKLMAVPGAVLVGPIPLDVQNYTIYSGAVSTASRNRAAADETVCWRWPIRRTCRS